jgi:uncharacterized Zn-binding protein involved in type VI secretion
MFAAARIGDPATHDGTAPSGVIGPPTTPPTKGIVMIDGLPAAHVTCVVGCSGATSAGSAHPPPGAAPPPPIVVGEPTVLIHGFPAARWAPSGDLAACGAMLGDAKQLATRTVFIGKQSAAMAKGPRLASRKWQIAVGHALADALPEGDEKKKELNEAANRFEKNNRAIEQARLAQNVYKRDEPAPEGWKNISDDPQALEKIGLAPDDLTEPGSEYRAQVYAPDPAVFGDDQKTTVAFQGTRVEKREDWDNNVAQGRDKESRYYRKSVALGRRLATKDADVEITGHSLGGGMASAASRASGKPATTFNAAGLHENTVQRYGGTVHVPDPENIQAYRVNGDVLTGAQEHGVFGTAATIAAGFAVGGPWGAAIAAAAKIGLASAMPNAVGTPHVVDGSWDPVQRHFMSQAIAGIEKQKDEDQATILAAMA